MLVFGVVVKPSQTSETAGAANDRHGALDHWEPSQSGEKCGAETTSAEVSPKGNPIPKMAETVMQMKDL